MPASVAAAYLSFCHGRSAGGMAPIARTSMMTRALATALSIVATETEAACCPPHLVFVGRLLTRVSGRR